MAGIFSSAALRSLKGWKLLLVVGLVIIPGATVGVVLLRKKNRWNPFNRLLLLLSPYRRISRYLVAHSKVETANLTSHVYQVDNNLFGMKVPNVRPHYGSPGLKAPEAGNPYLHFAFDWLSVLDMIKYLKYVNFPRDVSGVTDYAAELVKRNYNGPDAAKLANAIKVYL